ncbi:MAG: class I SAM-dependent methyltransferase [Rhodothermaceae bacterium]|nr:class I SAM-dependent methyltransferase [Rhodothermaceae bacterium]
MKEFWDNRYSDADYAYGKEPNAFFREQTDLLKPGNMLLPGEGEGRNAVYAARRGWQVKAIDYSEEGKRKAEQLAAEFGVSIKYEVNTIEKMRLQPTSYDAAAFIYVHLPADAMGTVVKNILQSLKKGGVILMEFFSKKQLGLDSGGPKSPDLLYTTEQVESWLTNTRISMFREAEIRLDEGLFHQGSAWVIQAVAIKE